MATVKRHMQLSLACCACLTASRVILDHTCHKVRGCPLYHRVLSLLNANSFTISYTIFSYSNNMLEVYLDPCTVNSRKVGSDLGQ